MKKTKNLIRILGLVILLSPVLYATYLFAYILLFGEDLCSNRRIYESFKLELATIFSFQKLYYLEHSEFTDSVQNLEKLQLLLQEVKQEYSGTKEHFTQTKEQFIKQLNPGLKISDDQLNGIFSLVYRSSYQPVREDRRKDRLDNQLNFSLSQSSSYGDTLNIVYSGAWKPLYIRIFALKDESDRLNFVTHACLPNFDFQTNVGFPLAPDVTKVNIENLLRVENIISNGYIKCPFGFKNINTEIGGGIYCD